MRQDFAHRYAEQISAVYAYLAYRHGCRAEAEELTYATFERALEQGLLGANGRSTRVSLLGIARELTSDRDPRAGSGADDPGVPADLAAALDSLGRRERSVIALRYGGELGASEISRLLKLDPESVRRVHSRGLRRLRTQLDLARDDPEGGGQEQREP